MIEQVNKGMSLSPCIHKKHFMVKYAKERLGEKQDQHSNVKIEISVDD